MTSRSTKRRLKKGKLLLCMLVLLIIIVSVLYFAGNTLLGLVSKGTKEYIASINNTVDAYDKDLKKVNTIIRGNEVLTYNHKLQSKDKKNTYTKIKYNNKYFYINSNDLTTDRTLIVKEKNVYVRTPLTIYSDINTGAIKGVSNKGTSLEVKGYISLNDDGSVNVYKINNNGEINYVYGKYVVLSNDEALANYDPTKYYDVHKNRGDRFGGGNAGNLDYYPVKKVTFKDNVMPSPVYALYLNNGSNVIGNIDAYIEYAKSTKINAFVVDIKDNAAPGYKSKVFEQYSPTNYKYAGNSFEKYKTAIKKIKDAGFYAIGRITVFKDKYYVQDNADTAIIDTRTNQPYLTASTYWPSPYQRKVWEFNVNLAKEAVKEMGFNEIQFDYVRFPDKVNVDEKNGIINYNNPYQEEKAQAIQRFVMYACDELHKLNTYVSIDVFGESAYNYVTAYGQYWASISNVVDVISGMPYPDHFNKYDFGFKEPVWTVPYDLILYWGSNYVIKRQSEIPTPAILRTWIQTTDVPSYKHPGGYVYGDTQIDAEIRGLIDAGLKGGYMTWSSTSSLDRYKSQINIYNKEYK